MGRGSSKAGGGYKLSSTEKEKITKGIETHTKEQNDGAEDFYKTNIAKEKNVVDNYEIYHAIGKVKSKDSEWWQSHEKSYTALKSKYEFFKKERKRIGK